MHLSRLFPFGVSMLCMCFADTSGWARFVEPVSGRDTSRVQNCGGIERQSHTITGECGLCGEEFGSTPSVDVTKLDKVTAVQINANNEVQVRLSFNASLDGYFEFKFCDLKETYNATTDNCRKQKPVHIGDVTQTRHSTKTGEKLTSLRLHLPEVTCSTCLIQWKYSTGIKQQDAHGDCVGCGGPKEVLYDCAIVKIIRNGIPTRNTRRGRRQAIQRTRTSVVTIVNSNKPVSAILSQGNAGTSGSEMPAIFPLRTTGDGTLMVGGRALEDTSPIKRTSMSVVSTFNNGTTIKTVRRINAVKTLQTGSQGSQAGRGLKTGEKDQTSGSTIIHVSATRIDGTRAANAPTFISNAASTSNTEVTVSADGFSGTSDGAFNSSHGSFVTADGFFNSTNENNATGEGGYYYPPDGVYNETDGLFYPPDGVYNTGDGYFNSTDGYYYPNEPGMDSSGGGYYYPPDGIFNETDGLFYPPDGVYNTAEGYFNTTDGYYYPNDAETIPSDVISYSPPDQGMNKTDVTITTSDVLISSGNVQRNVTGNTNSNTTDSNVTSSGDGAILTVAANMTSVDSTFNASTTVNVTEADVGENNNNTRSSLNETETLLNATSEIYNATEGLVNRTDGLFNETVAFTNETAVIINTANDIINSSVLVYNESSPETVTVDAVNVSSTSLSNMSTIIVTSNNNTLNTSEEVLFTQGPAVNTSSTIVVENATVTLLNATETVTDTPMYTETTYGITQNETTTAVPFTETTKTPRAATAATIISVKQAVTRSVLSARIDLSKTPDTTDGYSVIAINNLLQPKAVNVESNLELTVDPYGGVPIEGNYYPVTQTKTINRGTQFTAGSTLVSSLYDTQDGKINTETLGSLPPSIRKLVESARAPPPFNKNNGNQLSARGIVLPGTMMDKDGGSVVVSVQGMQSKYSRQNGPTPPPVMPDIKVVRQNSGDSSSGMTSSISSRSGVRGTIIQRSSSRSSTFTKTNNNINKNIDNINFNIPPPIEANGAVSPVNMVTNNVVSTRPVITNNVVSSRPVITNNVVSLKPNKVDSLEIYQSEFFNGKSQVPVTQRNPNGFNGARTRQRGNFALFPPPRVTDTIIPTFPLRDWSRDVSPKFPSRAKTETLWEASNTPRRADLSSTVPRVRSPSTTVRRQNKVPFQRNRAAIRRNTSTFKITGSGRLRPFSSSNRGRAISKGTPEGSRVRTTTRLNTVNTSLNRNNVNNINANNNRRFQTNVTIATRSFPGRQTNSSDVKFIIRRTINSTIASAPTDIRQNNRFPKDQSRAAVNIRGSRIINRNRTVSTAGIQGQGQNVFERISRGDASIVISKAQGRSTKTTIALDDASGSSRNGVFEKDGTRLQNRAISGRVPSGRTNINNKWSPTQRKTWTKTINSRTVEATGGQRNQINAIQGQKTTDDTIRKDVGGVGLFGDTVIKETTLAPVPVDIPPPPIFEDPTITSDVNTKSASEGSVQQNPVALPDPPPPIVGGGSLLTENSQGGQVTTNAKGTSSSEIVPDSEFIFNTGLSNLISHKKDSQQSAVSRETSSLTSPIQTQGGQDPFRGVWLSKDIWNSRQRHTLQGEGRDSNALSRAFEVNSFKMNKNSNNIPRTSGNGATLGKTEVQGAGSSSSLAVGTGTHAPELPNGKLQGASSTVDVQQKSKLKKIEAIQTWQEAAQINTQPFPGASDNKTGVDLSILEGVNTIPSSQIKLDLNNNGTTDQFPSGAVYESTSHTLISQINSIHGNIGDPGFKNPKKQPVSKAELDAKILQTLEALVLEMRRGMAISEVMVDNPFVEPVPKHTGQQSTVDVTSASNTDTIYVQPIIKGSNLNPVDLLEGRKPMDPVYIEQPNVFDNINTRALPNLDNFSNGFFGQGAAGEITTVPSNAASTMFDLGVNFNGQKSSVDLNSISNSNPSVASWSGGANGAIDNTKQITDGWVTSWRDMDPAFTSTKTSGDKFFPEMNVQLNNPSSIQSDPQIQVRKETGLRTDIPLTDWTGSQGTVHGTTSGQDNWPFRHQGGLPKTGDMVYQKTPTGNGVSGPSFNRGELMSESSLWNLDRAAGVRGQDISAQQLTMHTSDGQPLPDLQGFTSTKDMTVPNAGIPEPLGDTIGMMTNDGRTSSQDVNHLGFSNAWRGSINDQQAIGANQLDNPMSRDFQTNGGNLDLLSLSEPGSMIQTREAQTQLTQNVPIAMDSTVQVAADTTFRTDGGMQNIPPTVVPKLATNRDQQMNPKTQNDIKSPAQFSLPEASIVLCKPGEAFACTAVGAFQEIPGMVWWCFSHCKHGICPQRKCQCACQPNDGMAAKTQDKELAVVKTVIMPSKPTKPPPPPSKTRLKKIITLTLTGTKETLIPIDKGNKGKTAKVSGSALISPTSIQLGQTSVKFGPFKCKGIHAFKDTIGIEYWCQRMCQTSGVCPDYICSCTE